MATLYVTLTTSLFTQPCQGFTPPVQHADALHMEEILMVFSQTVLAGFRNYDGFWIDVACQSLMHFGRA